MLRKCMILNCVIQLAVAGHILDIKKTKYLEGMAEPYTGYSYEECVQNFTEFIIIYF